MAQSGEHAVPSDFADRLARIEKLRRKNGGRPTSAPKKERRYGYALSLVAALIVGYLVIMLARYARFHLTGIVPGDAGVDMNGLTMELGIAMMASLVLRMIFHFKSAEHAGAKAMGMIIALFTMHMWVHAFPDAFTLMFSDVWVNRVIWLTEPTELAVF